MDLPTQTRVSRLVRILAVTLALALAGRGIGYIGPAAPTRVPKPLTPLEELLPLPVWALLCFGIAAVIVLGVLRYRPAYTLGLIAYCAINGAWIASYVTAWGYGYSDRGWITGIGYCPELAAGLVLLLIGPPRPLIRSRE